MNIYIYGDKSFKQEIHKTLDHANIKFKLGDGYIEDVASLELLKEAIKSNPDDIYLIDNSKIIDKDSINSKIKFLKPKDGIEKEFLQEHGIGDVSVDSMESLAKHITKRLDYILENEDILDDATIDEIVTQSEEFAEPTDVKNIIIDDELSELLEYDEENDIDTSTIDDTQKSQENIKDEDIKSSEEIEDTDSSDDLSFDLDDLPVDLLSFDEIESQPTNDDFSDIMNIDEEFEEGHALDSEDLMNIDEMFEANEETEKDEQKEQISKQPQGEEMSSQINELSDINEEDILAALEGINLDTAMSSSKPQIKNNATNNTTISAPTQQSTNLQGLDLNQISSLISELLKNKTLDISIKIRD